MSFLTAFQISLLFQVTVSLEVTYKVDPDSVVQGTVIKNLTAGSVEQCSVECTSDGNCGAANYNRASGECELLAVDPTGPDPVANAGSDHLCCSCVGAISGIKGEYYCYI